MNKYWAYWKRGWWTWLLMLCANITILVLIFPAAFIFNDNAFAYYFSSLIIFLVIGAPLWGWLFEKFASNSTRLNKFEQIDQFDNKTPSTTTIENLDGPAVQD